MKFRQNILIINLKSDPGLTRPDFTQNVVILFSPKTRIKPGHDWADI